MYVLFDEWNMIYIFFPFEVGNITRMTTET